MNPAQPPTVVDLYLAFRQAKTALFFEKRGVGLFELAAYEAELPRNLEALRTKLTTASWFDELELGETRIVPKRQRPTNAADDGVVRIGISGRRALGRPLDVQLRLTASFLAKVVGDANRVGPPSTFEVPR